MPLVLFTLSHTHTHAPLSQTFKIFSSYIAVKYSSLSLFWFLFLGCRHKNKGTQARDDALIKPTFTYCPTNSALFISSLLSSGAEIFADKHRLSVQNRGRTCEKLACNVRTFRLSFPFCTPPLLVGHCWCCAGTYVHVVRVNICVCVCVLFPFIRGGGGGGGWRLHVCDASYITHLRMYKHTLCHGGIIEREREKEREEEEEEQKEEEEEGKKTIFRATSVFFFWEFTSCCTCCISYTTTVFICLFFAKEVKGQIRDLLPPSLSPALLNQSVYTDSKKKPLS